MDYVAPNRAAEALAVVEGFPFERFVSDFMSALLGSEFVPLGGVNDGGADGLLADAKGRFLQTSIRDDVATKIRHTVKRLREFGREPKQLIYVSSKEVRFPDTIEDELTTELDVTIRIRDAGYIKSHLNDSSGTRAAYLNHLHALTLDLTHASQTALIAHSPHVKDPSVFVFLSQEVDDNRGSQSLMNDVIDSLVLWALEGTDPDQGILMSEDEVMAKILHALPSVENLVRSRLRKRLAALSSKGVGGKRRVRNHRREGVYCLPYDTRESLASDIADDRAARTEVETSLRNRVEASESDEPLPNADEVETCVEACMRTLQLAFERQGITVMGALGSTISSSEDAAATGDDEADGSKVYLSDHLAAAMDSLDVDGEQRVRIGRAALAALRGVIFGSTPSERVYLRKLAKTYTLLFTLSLDPRLISFFQQMTGNFYLYAGSDQLVRAMSETYLEPADQVVTNTLKLASQAGARLILTEPALSEVMHNLRTSDYEYRNTFAKLSDSAPYEVVRNSPKILVRAYMYARMGMGKKQPSNWPSFINRFCDYADLHRTAAFDALRRYLQAEYNFEYKSSSDLGSLVDTATHNALAKTLVESSGKLEVLAENDALIALAVYGHRRRQHETSSISEFGYHTWWLTQESQILRHTRDLVAQNHGTGYIMRPEFLLNFLTLAPSAAAARDTFNDIFPSLLGVNLSRRMPEKSFRTLLDRITGAEEMSPARRTAKMSQMADRLKGDFARTYLATHDGATALTGVDALADRTATQELDQVD